MTPFLLVQAREISIEFFSLGRIIQYLLGNKTETFLAETLQNSHLFTA